MSFSEMMQTSRGPGVVGMFLALLVLCGFGVLFLMSVNEAPPGEKLTTQSVIAEQARELGELAAAIALKQRELAAIPKLQAAERKLKTAKLQLTETQERSDLTKQRMLNSQQQLAAKATALETYKDQYREAVRQGAKGEKIAQLKTRSGNTYENAVIDEVDPVGMKISHPGGMVRIPYDQLPAALQERFQFDATQKATTTAAEDTARKEHEKAVAEALRKKQEKDEARQQDAQQRDLIDAKKAIAIKTDRIAVLEREITSLRSELEREKQKKFRNTPRITSQINEKQQLRDQLQAEVDDLRSRL